MGDLRKSGRTENGFLAQHARFVTVVAVVFGATSGIFGALTAAPSMAIGFWRLTIALPFFAIPVFLSKEKRNRMILVSQKDKTWCFLAGLFLFGHFFFWFHAVKLTDIASAAVLAALHPLVVLLVTVLVMKRKVGLPSVCAILIALGGGALITGADLMTLAGGRIEGNLCASLAAIFMGLYFSAGDFLRQKIDGESYVLLVFFSCWLCFAVGSAATETPLLGYSLSDYGYIVLMAFLCQIGAHAVFNMCIGYVSSLYVSAWEAGEPVFSTLLALMFLHQRPEPYEIAGCILVVGALLFYNYQESRVGQNEL